jgi:tetratricopeptide (TPR) repeat protein
MEPLRDSVTRLLHQGEWTQALQMLAKMIANPSITYAQLSECYAQMQSILRSHLDVRRNGHQLLDNFLDVDENSLNYIANEICVLTILLDPNFPHKNVSEIESLVLKRIEKFMEFNRENDKLGALCYLLLSNAYLSMNDFENEDDSKEEAEEENEPEEKEEEEQLEVEEASEKAVEDDKQEEEVTFSNEADDEKEDDNVEESEEEEEEEATFSKHEETADKMLDIGISKYPDFSLLYRNKASLYNITGVSNENALEYILKAKEICEEPSIYYTEGMIRQDLGMYSEAIALFNKSLETEPNDAHTYYNIAQCYENLSEIEKALEFYAKTIELKPDHASAYASRAKLYAVNDKIQLALDNYNSALKIAPDNAETLFERGLLYRDVLADQDAALKDFERAHEVDPDDQNIQLALLAQEKLIICIKDIADSEPNDWSVYLSRGQLYLELMNKPSLALEDFNTALEMSTGRSQAILYLNRGYAHIELTEFELAKQDMEKAVELDTTVDHVYAKKAKKAIKELKTAGF